MTAAPSPFRILLVEDNPDDVFLIEALLAGVPDEVRPALATAGTLAGGLAAVAAGGVDLVLLDLSLPDSMGIETVRRFLAGGRATPVVVMTGLDDEAVAVAAVQAGAQDYLVKGAADARGLIRTLRHAMERHRLVRDLERARAEEAHRATHDALTGLPNRILLFDRLGHALAHAARYERHVAVLFIDLDGFKDVNDTYGHAAGDAMLRAAAERLAGCIRRSDTLARMGGDEFVILFEHVDHPGRAANLAQLVLTRIEGPARIEGREIPIRLSIGIAVSGEDGETADELLAAADRRMYDMKERGRASAG